VWSCIKMSKYFLLLAGALTLASVAAPVKAAELPENTASSLIQDSILANQGNPQTSSGVTSNLLSQNLQPPATTPQVAVPAVSAPIAQPLRNAPSVADLEEPLPPAPTSTPAPSQSQVTSVGQLSDVRPTDWAYQAVQSLVERYGCIVGYPNSTFRGNRAATRYELAAALNACLDVMSDRFATKEDLLALRKLMEEFAKELAMLKGRVNGLEARAAKLEATQFSTTTKLNGEAIFQATQFGAGRKPVPAGRAQGADGIINDNFFVNGRATLNLLTSFSGKDLLVTSLQAGNFPTDTFGLPSGFSGTLAPQITQTSEGNRFSLYALQYRFPMFNDRFTFIATAAGGELSDFVDTLNPYFDSDGQGSLSAFGLRNPIYRQITRFAGTEFSGAGGGFTVNINKKLSFGAGYLVPLYSSANPIDQGTGARFIDGGGLFGGDYAAIAQLTYKPLDNLGFGLAYVRSYSKSPFFGSTFAGYTGSIRANTGFSSILNTNSVVPTSSNSVGFQFSWAASQRMVISGWAGASFVRAEADDRGGPNVDNQGNPVFISQGDTATILNYALTFAFPDLFSKGSMGGFVIGSQPWVVSSSIANNTDPNLNLHLEAFYRYQVSDNISLTPGIIAVINPEGNSANPPVVLGTIRATFTF
jgi:Carbohydrate-selective porin, OprB family/S-layer homology domain